MRKLLSIIVTCYNNDKYIEKCINSVSRYLSKDIELIIINDGSLDNSEKVIKNTIRNNKFISYYCIEHSGVSCARNYGMKKSCGKYIMFVDGDDYLYKDSINNIIDYIKNNCFDLLLLNTIKYYENNDCYEREILNIKDINKINTSDLILNKICARPWRFIYNSDIIKKNNLCFHENLIYEDEEWIPKVIYYSKDIKLLENGYYVYVKHDNSIMSSINFDKILNLIKIVESTYEWSLRCSFNRYNYFSLSRCVKRILSYLLKGNEFERDVIIKWYRNNYNMIMKIIDGNKKLRYLLIIFGPYKGIMIYKKYVKEKYKVKKVKEKYID